MLLRGEMALGDADQHDGQNQRAHGDVGAVEAGQHEEGGAIDARVQRQPQVVIGVLVFQCLQHQKDRAQRDGQAQPGLGSAAIVFAQGVVGKGDGHAGGDQQQGVDQRQLPGADHLAGTGKGFGVRVDHQRPLISEIRPEHVGQALVALTTEPRAGKGTHVEQGAEEGGKEHHFREDEPAHAHAEGAVHLRAVEALAAFLHHIAEPAEHHPGGQECTGKEQPAAQAAAGSGAVAVHHAAAAKHQQQQRYRGNDRPLALGRHIVGLMIGHLLFSLYGNRAQWACAWAAASLSGIRSDTSNRV